MNNHEAWWNRRSNEVWVERRDDRGARLYMKRLGHAPDLRAAMVLVQLNGWSLGVNNWRIPIAGYPYRAVNVEMNEEVA